jgi:O-acetyl-ADP-ribose deacetylase (regulator of RNase III)
MYLCEDILEKAGQSVQQEYAEAAETSLLEPFETNAGHLRCRKLLFLPWLINQTSTEAFYQSIRNFVSQAVQHAVKAHHTSIAFPSIGCGKLNVDKNIVANEMLVEAQKQLLTANVLLQIIFVILPDQIDVFEAFEAKLESLQKGNVETKDIQIAYSLSSIYNISMDFNFLFILLLS